MSALNRRLVVHDVRKALEALEPDVVFLQEVQGSHERRAQQFTYWPESPQHEFLEHGELKSVYGRNAVHKLGHHGNALLSRFPVVRWGNHDITLNRFEHRGLLHCVLDVPGWEQPLHAFCVHLNLLGRDRASNSTSWLARSIMKCPMMRRWLSRAILTIGGARPRMCCSTMCMWWKRLRPCTARQRVVFR